MSYVAAMTDEVDRVLRDHLVRADGQADICFALWHQQRYVSLGRDARETRE